MGKSAIDPLFTLSKRHLQLIKTFHHNVFNLQDIYYTSSTELIPTQSDQIELCWLGDGTSYLYYQSKGHNFNNYNVKICL